MTTKHLKVTEHVIPTQYIREYPYGTRHRRDVRLKLAVKQYTPLKQASASDEDAVTIIATQANGFPKEVYEPLWDDLYEHSRKSGSFKLRGIWIADMSSQGVSGVLNEYELGDDPNWHDHSRDLLHLINTFSDQMPRPIIGLGHSLGCAQLMQLSMFHPRLFTTLILIDPAVLPEAPARANAALVSSLRKDRFSSKQDAETQIRGHMIFKGWDKRALKLYLQHGIRYGPTAIYPDARKDEATLTTTKAQESWIYVRPAFNKPDTEIDRILYPDLCQEDRPTVFFPSLPSRTIQKNPQIALVGHRAEGVWDFMQLPFLRPSIFYIAGKLSYMSKPKLIQDRMENTGTGIGGNGGARLGKVKTHVFEKGGHLLPMQNGIVEELAKVTGEWIDQQLQIWRKEEDFHAKWNSEKSKDKGDGQVLSEKWMDMVKKPSQTRRVANGDSKL